MKKHQDRSKLVNESVIEDTLMDNMFNFCIAKYPKSSISQIESHFLNLLASMIERGELDIRTVKRFLDEKGIEGDIPKKSPTPASKTTYSGYDPCGSSRSTRSSC